ncbi:hypothetical protein [Clostridium sp.]|uniref:hypothetical protein n=1 Tax=Clostridium sp. TaxID=1506 RepID=UPI0025BF6902|nr:hypothetical protein [Clostridium sp.]
MDLSEYRAIKDYSYIKIFIDDTHIKFDTTNSISFIYKDEDIYIKISSEVFTDDMIELHKDIIKRTLEKEDCHIRVEFIVNEINTHGNRIAKENIIDCSFGIPNDIIILDINYSEIASIDYYFKVNDINELNL